MADGPTPLPATVQVGPFTYRVTTDETDVLKAKAAEGGCIGRFDSQHELIVLDPDQSPGCMADTLLHELLHALCSLTGLAQDFSHEDNERICYRLAPTLIDLVRRNPDLVAYLENGGSGERRK